MPACSAFLWRGGSTSSRPGSAEETCAELYGLYTLLLGQILRGRTLRRRDRAAAAVDLDECSVARGGRRRDRRHRERRRARSRARRADSLRELQSGNTRSYATWVVVGAVGRYGAAARNLDGATKWKCSHIFLTVITFLPLLGAPALLLLRADDHVWIRRIALVAVAGRIRAFAASASRLRHRESAATSSRKFTPGFRSSPIHYHLGVDGISLFLVIADDVPDADFDSGFLEIIRRNA